MKLKMHIGHFLIKFGLLPFKKIEVSETDKYTANHLLHVLLKN